MRKRIPLQIKKDLYASLIIAMFNFLFCFYVYEGYKTKHEQFIITYTKFILVFSNLAITLIAISLWRICAIRRQEKDLRQLLGVAKPWIKSADYEKWVQDNQNEVTQNLFKLYELIGMQRSRWHYHNKTYMRARGVAAYFGFNISLPERARDKSE